MHAFKMNTNTNENTVMLAILATSNTSHSVPKKTNSVYIMNDDDTLVPCEIKMDVLEYCVLRTSPI